MSTCSQTNKPTINQVVDSCKGFHLSTKCIYTDLALTYISITAGSSLESILQALTQALQNSNTRISVLEATVDEINPTPYETFVGLVTQTGTYPTISSSTPTPFVIGNTYYISYLASGDDFSNIGYTQINVPFIATETTPTTWTNGSQVREVLSSVFPIITPIQNTLGITLTPSFRGANTFFLNSDLPVFLISKTLLYPFGTIYNDGSTIVGGGLVRFDDSTLISPTIVLGQIRPFIIEIKVYN